MRLRGRNVVIKLLKVIGLVLIEAAAHAQTVSPFTPPAPAFPRMFPNPTGLNGYEDFVIAGDIMSSSAAWYKFELSADDVSDVTLSSTRRILSDPQVMRALAAFRGGLAKPIQSPLAMRDAVTSDSDISYLPFSGFRMISRLLAKEMYVLLADGKTAEAIGCLRDAITFGYGVQRDSYAGGLMGLVIGAVAVYQVARHVDQFSARDCEQIVSLAKEWLNLPDPEIGLFVGQRDASIRTLQKFRSNLLPLIRISAGTFADVPLDGKFAVLAQQLSASPEAAGPMVDSAIAILTERYNGLIAALQLPPWKRESAPEAGAETSAAMLADVSMPALGNEFQKFKIDQARVQMLAVHAAVNRYRWEYQRLPASLDVLNLGRLGIDPFTGKPFEYKLVGKRGYEVLCAGPFYTGQAYE